MLRAMPITKGLCIYPIKTIEVYRKPYYLYVLFKAFVLSLRIFEKISSLKPLKFSYVEYYINLLRHRKNILLHLPYKY